MQAVRDPSKRCPAAKKGQDATLVAREVSEGILPWATSGNCDAGFGISDLSLDGENAGEFEEAAGEFDAASAGSIDSPSEEVAEPTDAEKKSKKKKKPKKPTTLNTGYARSSAEVYSLVADKLGWDVHDRTQVSSNITMCVSEDQLQTVLRRGLSPKQYCGRILGMGDVCSKCACASIMTLSQELSPGSCSFFPRTWVLPQEWSSLQQFMEGKSEPLICKPDEGAQGDGIFITTSFDDLQSRLRSLGGLNAGNVVVQRYIEKPLLLNSLKFDLRVYVLVAALDPLTVYVCREGLARFCTSPYRAPSSKNLHHLTGHLTNYSLNKHSADFVHATAEEDADSSKRTIHSVFAELATQGLDAEELWGGIERVVGETCRACQPWLLEVLQTTASKDKLSNMRGYDGGPGTFHLLGFDVMLDQHGRPWLLEINCSPRLAIDCIENVNPAQVEDPKDICRCMEDYRPHIHKRCDVDHQVKTAAIAGALLIVDSNGGTKRISAAQAPLLECYRQVCGPPFGRGQDGLVRAGLQTDVDVGGEDGLMLGVLCIYTRISGPRRKVDGIKLRNYVKTWGIAKLQLHTVDSMYLEYRGKAKQGGFGFEEFVALLRGLVAKVYPEKSVREAIQLLVSNELQQHGATGLSNVGFSSDEEED